MNETTNALRYHFENYMEGRIPLIELVTILAQSELHCAIIGLDDAHPEIEMQPINVPVVVWRRNIPAPWEEVK